MLGDLRASLLQPLLNPGVGPRKGRLRWVIEGQPWGKAPSSGSRIQLVTRAHRETNSAQGLLLGFWLSGFQLAVPASGWPVPKARASLLPTSQGSLVLPLLRLVCETEGESIPGHVGYPDSLRCVRKWR